jgi:hypothetical protein
MATKDKRDLILECLRDRSTSADAILNHLHQNGWAVVLKADVCDCASPDARPRP